MLETAAVLASFGDRGRHLFGVVTALKKGKRGGKERKQEKRESRVGRRQEGGRVVREQCRSGQEQERERDRAELKQERVRSGRDGAARVSLATGHGMSGRVRLGVRV